jgi:HD-GYP domain-containing protein (c-di-GMP phosphodiesterase class II)
MKELPPRLETGVTGQSSGDSAFILKTIFQIFPDLLFYLDKDDVIIDYLASESVTFYAAPKNFLGQRLLNVLPKNIARLFAPVISNTRATGQISTLEYDQLHETGLRSYSAQCIQIDNVSLVIVIRDTTAQKRMTEMARKRQQYMLALQESAHELSKEMDSRALGIQITHACVDKFGARAAWLGWVKVARELEELAYAPDPDDRAKQLFQIKPSEVELNHLFENKTYVIIENASSKADEEQTRAFFPLISHDQIIGVLGLCVEETDFFTSECVDFFRAYNLLAASAIQNARLYEDSRRQLSQMQTWRSIDQAILSNLDLKSTASVILKEAAKHIHVDALALLVLDPKTQTLNFVDGYGFRYDTLKHSHLKIGESFAGQVALEKRRVHVRNLEKNPKNFSRAATFKEEGFMMYLGIPLVARMEVRGVLEIFQRKPYEPDEEWLTLLETLANQIAIAIDNALLVKFLKDSNMELNSAYDATIEGLSRALELRDRETEGHTRRVTEMTVDLARRIGVPEADVTQIRQGALLHDIGKMGIPDAILLKPGALMPDEWKIMQQHPIYAYELLSQVEHLKPAMDIPLYHHEKWDGTGYPYGLNGEQIPFAARLFSFADVYDALISDRPYRTAWPKEKALFYIQSQVGIYFDPSILPIFNKLILRETVPLPKNKHFPTKSSGLPLYLK